MNPTVEKALFFFGGIVVAQLACTSIRKRKWK